MLKHLVLFKLKSLLSAEERKLRAEEIKTALETLPAKIPEILSFEVGLNVLESERAYDLAIVSEFLNTETLAIYSEHHEHKKVVELIALSKENAVSVDYYF